MFNNNQQHINFLTLQKIIKLQLHLNKNFIGPSPKNYKKIYARKNNYNFLNIQNILLQQKRISSLITYFTIKKANILLITNSNIKYNLNNNDIINYQKNWKPGFITNKLYKKIPYFTIYLDNKQTANKVTFNYFKNEIIKTQTPTIILTNSEKNTQQFYYSLIINTTKKYQLTNFINLIKYSISKGLIKTAIIFKNQTLQPTSFNLHKKIFFNRK